MTGEGYEALREHLRRECALLVRLLHRQSARDWTRSCPPFQDRAALASHVAEVLAAAGLAAERAGARGGAGPGVHAWPSVPAYALPDAVAVCAHDLLDALDALPDDAAVEGAARVTTARHLAASVLAEVLLHRHDLDGAAPGPQASAAVLTALDEPFDGAPRRAVLVVAAARCRVGR